MTPFIIEIPDEQLEDLRRRLRATRWPAPATAPGWAQGVPLEWLRELVEYWIDGYEWRTRESRLNAHPHVLVEIDGLDIHAVHVRSPHPGATPVVLTHGWPGSFAEYLAVAEALADPIAHGGSVADACHVVLPSLPGYAFSGKPLERGWGVDRIADAWVELMQALGYDRFTAGGSDWGTSVSAALGARHPARVHALVLIPPLAAADPDADDPTPAERKAVATLGERERDGSAYSAIHRTRPQTLGYALADSPAGLAAWIAEKFWAWSDHAGVLDSAIPRDELLDTVMLYWLTDSGASSARLYLESIGDVSAIFTTRVPVPIDVPVGGIMFPHEVPWVSRRLAERRFPDIRVWVEPEYGGHFGALENPAAVIDGIIRTVRAAR
jgi:epoxide hydrolase